MYDPDWWIHLIATEWAMILAALAATVVGWLVGWLFIRLRSKRSMQMGKARLSLAEHERDIERCQREGLRNALKELKPDVPVLATEIGYGDPEIKQVVLALAAGAKISTRVDPSKNPIPTGEKGIKRIAVLSYTFANGLLQTRRWPFRSTSSGTAKTIEIAGLLPTSEPKKDESR
jgi:hypothetical protein